jgi:predicted nucleic acid-binding protein
MPAGLGGPSGSGYLLDTNVVSALRVRGRNPAVEAWAAAIPHQVLFVASLSIAEIELGIAVKERTDRAQGAVLRRWFEDRLLPGFAGRVLSFDLAAARILATYRVPDRAPLDDAVIAATAAAADLTVATPNTAHFAPLGVALVNPWET